MEDDQRGDADVPVEDDPKGAAADGCLQFWLKSCSFYMMSCKWTQVSRKRPVEMVCVRVAFWSFMALPGGP